MTNDKVNQVLRDLIAIELADVKPARLPGEAHWPTGPMALAHCRALAELALDMPADKLEKKFRWLGFIQGVLWSFGILSLEALKRANMPDDERATLEQGGAHV